MQAWSISPWLVGWLLLVLAVYLRGFLPRMRRGASAFRPWRAFAFAGGLLACFVALSSPLDTFGGYLLSVHMSQHLVLMMVVPPLILAGNPGIPLMMGLPESWRREWIEPMLASARIRRLFSRIVNPVVGWLAIFLVTWIWHLPGLYELGIVSETWHVIEHVCFLLAAFLFWWPVVQPYPSKAKMSPWLLLVYLLSADVQNTVFSAIFVFATEVIYPVYLATSPAFGADPLRDQALAGAIMWVAGSVAFLIPVGVIFTGLAASGAPAAVRRRQRLAAASAEPVMTSRGPVSLPQYTARESVNTRSAPRQLNMRSMPVVGAFLRSRNARQVARLVVLLLAAVIVLDGFLGPRSEAMNAAGVLPFTHWRGVLVLGLLLLGNVFCAVCPFILPRNIARRLLPGIASVRWPKVLRTKWIAVLIVVGWLWAYEALALWANPLATAWIIIGYFVAAFVVDVVFKGAVFCKWICPIGQFNFVNSMVSPTEVAAVNPDICASCATRECIRGSGNIPGCELQLYIPAKVGNLDCTGCLDCADACPHQNVGVLSRSRSLDLVKEGWRSSIGRISRRSDLAALVVVLVFGAFANAAGMVAPILAWQDRLALQLGMENRLVPATLLVLGIVILVPLVLFVCATMVSMILGALGGATGRGLWRRYVFALVPIGAAMWLVHFGFHLATSAGTGISVLQRIANDLGITMMGTPAWLWGCCVTPPGWLLPLEIIALDLGPRGFDCDFLENCPAIPIRNSCARRITAMGCCGDCALRLWFVDHS